MKVLFTGGGTGGSVTPLLACAEELKEELKDDIEFLWVGTKQGPEKTLAADYNIPFKNIWAGKLRRYFNWRNFIDPVFILIGFFQAAQIINQFKPNVVVSAGSFIAVPVIWAAWLLGVPALGHQQDVKIGLANKLILPFLKKIMVVFPETAKKLPGKKTKLLRGNPIRNKMFEGDKWRAIEKLNLEPTLPVLLILGGGTGAARLNEILIQAAPELVEFCQVLHIAGPGQKTKQSLDALAKKYHFKFSRYHIFEFVHEELADFYATADLIISRAGMGTLSELAVLGKPTIIIPIPDTHQENNAQYFVNHKAAAALNQRALTPQVLTEKVYFYLQRQKKRQIMGENMQSLMSPDAAAKMANEVLKLIEKK